MNLVAACIAPAFLAFAPILTVAVTPQGAARADAGVPTPAVVSAPRYAPQTLEFGEMIPGQPKTMPFTVTNTGTESLVVESVKGGCGCTTVTAPPKGPIAPGASFTVDVTVDPGKKGGVDLVKPLYLTYAGGRVESVQIKGRVKALDPAAPPAIDAPDAEGASARVFLFRLPSAGGDGPARADAEAAQATIIRSIDAGIARDLRSGQFRMRLHRESGMLFVHGTDADVEAVRSAVRGLPASMAVRESRPLPGS